MLPTGVQPPEQRIGSENVTVMVLVPTAPVTEEIVGAVVSGAVALLLPGQADLRHGAQQSALLRRLNAVVSPEKVLNALARIDPFPAITGPAGPVTPPDPRLAHSAGVRTAAPWTSQTGHGCGRDR